MNSSRKCPLRNGFIDKAVLRRLWSGFALEVLVGPAKPLGAARYL